MHELVLDTEANSVLVAYMPTPKDMVLARSQGWYRIPVSDRSPLLLRNGKLTHIAFYQPSSFGEDRYTIRWYSPVTSLTVRRRIEVIPDEPHHPNSNKNYYIVGCKDVQELPDPIRSLRPRRRLIFLPTTLKRLLTAKDINQLFNDSPLESLLWNELTKADIPSERQFDVRVGERWFKLDFAVFCKTSNIDIECDGDKHHMDPASVEKDKWRANLLSAEGWHVLHLTSYKLRHEMPAAMILVRDAVNRYGGLCDPNSDGGYRYTRDPDEPQQRLFD